MEIGFTCLIIIMSLLGTAELTLVILSLTLLTFNNTVLYISLFAFFAFGHYISFCYCGIRMMLNKIDDMNACTGTAFQCTDRVNGCMIASLFCPVILVAIVGRLRRITGIVLLFSAPLIAAFRLLVLLSKQLSGTPIYPQPRKIFVNNLSISNGIGSVVIVVCLILYLAQPISSSDRTLATITLIISSLNVVGFYVVILLRANGVLPADPPPVQPPNSSPREP